jgi:integrase
MLLVLGCSTGFRISELLSLCRQDVLDPSGRIKPVLTVKRANMKMQLEARCVPLPKPVQEALRGWLVAQERAGLVLKGDPLFPTRVRPLGIEQVAAAVPMTRTAAWKTIRRLADRAGVQQANVGTHSMRKSFTAAVYGLWLGRLAKGERVDPLRQTQQALGHRHIQSTTSYLKSVTTEERGASFDAAAAAVEACFPKF